MHPSKILTCNNSYRPSPCFLLFLDHLSSESLGQAGWHLHVFSTMAICTVQGMGKYLV